MRAIDFWVILCYIGEFAALMEYIVVLHLTQFFMAEDNGRIKTEGNNSQRLMIANIIETVTKFLLPLYNIVFPIIYFVLCTSEGAK